jgi:hypothetical protein
LACIKTHIHQPQGSSQTGVEQLSQKALQWPSIYLFASGARPNVLALHNTLVETILTRPAWAGVKSAEEGRAKIIFC